MHSSPKFILLYGAVGAGKTTISEKYTNERPLSMCVDGDAIIAMMGQWLAHEDAARALVFEHTKHLAETQLAAGYDVIVPYLLTDAKHATGFEALADRLDVPFIEVLLAVEREASVQRALTRGTWGEPDAPPITEEDRPQIERLYDEQEANVALRSKTITVRSDNQGIEETYREFLAAVS